MPSAPQVFPISIRTVHYMLMKYKLTSALKTKAYSRWLVDKMNLALHIVAGFVWHQRASKCIDLLPPTLLDNNIVSTTDTLVTREPFRYQQKENATSLVN